MVTASYRCLGRVSPSSQNWSKSLHKVTHGLGGDWQKFRLHRGPTSCDKMFGRRCRKVSNFNKRKTVLCFDKPNLDNARKLRGIYYIDLDDMEFQGHQEKACVKSWKYHWNLHGMQNSQFEAWRNLLQESFQLSKIKILMCPRRARIYENVQWQNWQEITRTLLQKESFNSLVHYKMVHKPIPTPPVLLHSGLDGKWWVDSVEWYTFKTSYLTEKHLMNGVLENHSVSQ